MNSEYQGITAAASEQELRFRIGKHGVYCSLKNIGNTVWRLQANTRGRKFDSYGAAQQLASYLGETLTEERAPLSVRNENGLLCVTAPDGSFVTIGGTPFAVRFYSVNGKEASVISRIVSEKRHIRLSGTLTDREAVYGGGERFDTVNKRGTAFSLYTGDLWNNSNAIYAASPLFLSTRGSGLFLNHYQNIFADFGKTRRKEWRLDIHNDFLDCYIIASGNMKDALRFYTDLTGHAKKPEPWNYGPIVCRYGPDFNHLWEKDDDPDTLNKDGAPSGKGFETVISRFRSAGMPLTAVITEGWGYTGIFASREEKARWQEAVDWLHANQIKVMLYTRVASMIPDGQYSGFREEYCVRAAVTVNGVTEETCDIPDTAGDGVNPDARQEAGGIGTHRYIDITNPKAMKWYVDTVWGELVGMGFDGVKIDFCETFPDMGVDYGGITVAYHWHNPRKIRPGTEHHAYPTFFITQFFDRMNELKTKKFGKESGGFMVLTRGGGIGSQRNPYMWGGDQTRCFEKLPDQLMCTVNCGLSGIPFMTYDMAGYRYGGSGPSYRETSCKAVESRIFSRAAAFTALTSCMQTHGTVRHAYELDEDAQEIYRLYCTLHGELTGYIDALSEYAAETGIPPVRHPILEYPDDVRLSSVTDEFLLGDALLAAPILTDNTEERKVRLPEGRWRNLLTGKTVSGGKTFSVHANPAQIPLFLNLDCTEYDGLKKIFDGKTWETIRHYRMTTDPEKI